MQPGRFIGLRVLTFAALALPWEAHAIDMEYYAYGSFDTMVGAFKRLALIFSDTNFLTLAAAMVVLGILFGGTALYYKGLTGAPINFASWALPLIIGVAVFKALIVPTGTLHVYDPTRNEYQAVGGVPDAIVASAGVLNLIERSVVAVVDTGSAYPYANEAGGIAFELIYRATAEFTDIDDYYVTKSVGQYFADCSPIALNSAAFNVDLNQLKRDTTDLLPLLAEMRSASDFTLVYTTANKWGITATCQDAWDLYLQPVLGQAASFDSTIAGVCGKTGFNVNSVNQLQTCRELMARALEQYGIVGGSAIQFIRNSYLAQAIDRAMQERNPDLAQRSIANRTLMVQGIGIGSTANEWLPSMRGVVTAVALAMVPVLALFVVTPLMSKAIVFTLGLFGWITLWGITDAVVHQMAMDGAQGFFEQVKAYQWGLDAIWLSPEASAKALALFGKVRSMGVMMATVLAFALYRFGGYAFANMAQSLSHHVESAGAEASRQTQTPEGRAHTLNELAGAVGTHGNRAIHDFDAVANASIVEQAKASGVGARLYHALSGGSAEVNGRFTEGVGKFSAMQAGHPIGAFEGVMGMARALQGTPNPTQAHVASTAKMTSAVETARRVGDAQVLDRVLSDQGGGDKYEGSLDYAVAKVLSEYKGYETTGEMARRIQTWHQAQSGEPLSVQDAYRRLIQTREAALYGNIEAAGGDPGVVREAYETLSRFTFAERDALREVGQQFGVSVEAMGRAVGTLNAATHAGKLEALDQLSPAEVQAASAYNVIMGNLDGATKLDFAKSLASEANDDYVDTLQDKASFNAARDFALFTNLLNHAASTDRDFTELTLGHYGGTFSYPVTNKEEWEALSSHLRPLGLSDHTMDRLMTSNGYRGRATVTQDPMSGQPLQFQLSSGSEMVLKNTTTVDNTHSARGNVALDSGVILQGLQGGGTRQMQASLEGVFWKALADKGDGYYDSAEVRAFAEAANELYAPWGSATDGHTEIEGVNIRGSVEAKGVGSTGLLRIPVPIPLSGGVGAEGVSNDLEDQRFQTAGFLYTTALTHSLEQAHWEINQEQPDWAEDSTLFQQAQVRRAEDHFADFHTLLYSKYQDMGREALGNSNEWAKDTLQAWVKMRNIREADAIRGMVDEANSAFGIENANKPWYLGP